MGASAAKESKKEGETTSCKFWKLFYSSQITHHKVSFVFSLLPAFLWLVFQLLTFMKTGFQWLELGNQVDSTAGRF